MQQSDPIQGNTGLAGRNVGNFLTDWQNLRNWWHEPVGAAGLVNVPEQGSPVRLIRQLALEITGGADAGWCRGVDFEGPAETENRPVPGEPADPWGNRRWRRPAMPVASTSSQIGRTLSACGPF